MPRIRKKTSKRISTNQRAKFKHKVAEGRKKKKKLAKKNPQWKSKTKKDPGIPNNFPYKDQILAEIAETRRQAEEAKQRRREEKKSAREGALAEVEEAEDISDLKENPSSKGSSSKAHLEDEAPLLLNPDLPNLKAVLEKADVVLHVLDARDPDSFRLPHIEGFAGEKTKLAYVLNKIDLVPRETVSAWAKYLRTRHSTFLFRSASSFLPKSPLNDSKAKGKAKVSVDDALGSEALLEYLGQCAEAIKSETLQVAIVGITNSGKSAIVNSLAQKAVIPTYMPTSSTDAWTTTTTRAFEVSIEVSKHKINLVDTPGVSLQNDEEYDDALKTRDMLLRCRGRVDKVKDPVPAVEHIVFRAETQDMMVHYNLPIFPTGDCTAFLAGVARVSGLMKKGGDPDLTQAARVVLRDWTTGKLPFYTEPPVPSDKILESLDEKILTNLRTRKEMRKQGGLVKILPGEVEKRKVVLNVPFVLEDVSENEDEDEMYMEDEDEETSQDSEDESMNGGEDEEDDEEDEDIPIPALTGKRKRQTAAITTARPSKKVAFAAGVQDRNEKRAARSGKNAISAKSKSITKPTTTKDVAVNSNGKTPKASGKTKTSSVKSSSIKTADKLKNPVTALANGKATSEKTGDAYDFDQFFKV